MDFGSVVMMFGSVEQKIQKKVARSLGIGNPRILHSWLRSLNDVRNACAHHNRVWNRSWVKQPSLPQNVPVWNVQYRVESSSWELPAQTPRGGTARCGFDISKTGMMLTICKCLLDTIDSKSDWGKRVKHLLSHPAMTPLILSWMGLPPHWKSHPLWC